MTSQATAPSHSVITFAGGLASGLIAGLFGVGGGVLLVPLQVLVLGSAQHVAHATSLVAVTLAAAVGVARFAVEGAVHLPGAAALAAGAVVGARIGAVLLPRISDRRLRAVFGAVLLVLSVRFLLAPGSATAAADMAVPDLDATMIAAHVVGGLVAGVTSSVLGVGGGVVMVPLMALGLGYGQHIAEGTSLAVIVPTAATGAWAHARSGYTDWRAGLRLGVGAMAGAALGASVALGLSGATLGRLFGALQVLTAALMLRPGSSTGRKRS